MRKFRLSTLMRAIKIAETRFLEARAKNMNDATTYHSNYMEIMERDITGILGEMVVGRAIDPNYMPSVNTFHGTSDVVNGIEVRSTQHQNGSLIIRDNDDPSRKYVLVVVQPMIGFDIKGWVYGYEAKTDEWFKSDDGRPAWWYRGKLRQISDLLP
jgi:hypothetical protein